MSKTKKPRLGRGLSSLMSMPVSIRPDGSPTAEGAGVVEQVDGAANTVAGTGHDKKDAGSASNNVTAATSDNTSLAAGPDHNNGLVYLPIEAIRPNPHQPRQAFDPQALQRLADSIRQDGLMQPIVVRPSPREVEDAKGAGAATEATQYEIVAGERRWRAGQLAGLTQLPVLVRDLSDQQMAEWALIENLQREDLNPIERAEAFRGLIDQFGLSHEQVADRVGVERPTISNSLRLLDLQYDIQQMIRDNQLSAGHAKALGGLKDPMSQLAMARRAVAGGWSVRMVEAAVKRVTGPTSASEGETAASKRTARSAHLADLEQQIAAQLQTKVHIKTGRRKGSGTLSIDFYNLDQFDDLLGKLGVRLD